MNSEFPQAPELRTTQWFNTKEALSLEKLRGRVIAIEAFQMLCPSCVSHALPQAQKIHKMFNFEDVAVIGLHTVFEHHRAMKPTSLEAFLYEYRITFPVGVDAPSKRGSIPQTMAVYELGGTPSTILIDRRGCIRKHALGIQDDLLMGAEIMSLIKEPYGDTQTVKQAVAISSESNATVHCNKGGCQTK